MRHHPPATHRFHLSRPVRAASKILWNSRLLLTPPLPFPVERSRLSTTDEIWIRITTQRAEDAVRLQRPCDEAARPVPSGPIHRRHPISDVQPPYVQLFLLCLGGRAREILILFDTRACLPCGTCVIMTHEERKAFRRSIRMVLWAAARNPSGPEDNASFRRAPEVLQMKG